MNQKFIHSIFLGSLLFGLLAFGNFYANANGFKKNNTDSHTISASEFYNTLENTNPDQIAKTFGHPDKVTTLKNAKGDQAGVIWTYEKAVSKKNEKLDANFVYVAGEFKYVTLSDS